MLFRQHIYSQRFWTDLGANQRNAKGHQTGRQSDDAHAMSRTTRFGLRFGPAWPGPRAQPRTCPRFASPVARCAPPRQCNHQCVQGGRSGAQSACGVFGRFANPGRAKINCVKMMEPLEGKMQPPPPPSRPSRVSPRPLAKMQACERNARHNPSPRPKRSISSPHVGAVAADGAIYWRRRQVAPFTGADAVIGGGQRAATKTTATKTSSGIPRKCFRIFPGPPWGTCPKHSGYPPHRP